MKKRLHLGCGFDYKKGWVNVDRLKHVKADVCHDLDVYPYPFDDNSFDQVSSDGLVEHLEEPLRHFEEVWRICKPKATVEFKVPFYNSQNHFTDFTHRNSFSQHSMAMICDNTDGRRYITGKFDLVSVTPVRGRIGMFLPRFVCDKLCHVLGEVYQNIIFKIMVKK